MKKFLLALCCMIQCSLISYGQTNPYVSNPDISPSPIPTTNPNAVFTFNVGNSGQSVIPYNAGDEIILKITLSNGTPQNTTTPVASLGGTWLSYFNWSFNNGSNTYTGIQNKDIPATPDVLNPAQGTITINYRMTTPSAQATPQNGFNVNLTPNGGSIGNTTNDDHVDIFTYSRTPLPVKLTAFSGSGNKRNAVLSWVTADEQAFDRFDVQYSTTGNEFATIGQVKNKGNKNGSSYSFNYSQTAGKGYYRLKMVDLDGSSAMSNVISITTNCTERTIVLAPNPTPGIVHVSGLNAGDKIQVLNANGQTVAQKTAIMNNEEIDLANYAPGLYQVTISGNDEVLKTEKIMKR